MIYSDCLLRQFVILTLPAFASLLIARLYVFHVGCNWNLRSLAFLNKPEEISAVLYSGKISNSLLVTAFVFVFISSFLWCNANLSTLGVISIATFAVSLIVLVFAYLFVASYIFACVIVLGDIVYIRTGLGKFSVVMINVCDILSCQFYINRIYNTVMFLKIETSSRNYVVNNILNGDDFVQLINKIKSTLPQTSSCR